MIDPSAKIDCKNFTHGPGLIVRAGAEIYGDTVTLGRDCFIDEYAVIGGGSAGNLTTGDFFHMGMFSQVNTARDVTIGHEVGLGIGTKVFTHGAYLSEYDGFPCSFESVTIGDRVWIPSAIVLPGVTIGSDVVVAAGSVVTKDLTSGLMYGGVPAKFINGAKNFSVDRTAVLEQFGYPHLGHCLYCCGAVFNLAERTIEGPVTDQSEALRNELRRHGIRFRFEPSEGGYRAWTS